MAGQLDSAFKQIAKQVVADLGSSFDSSIVYTRKASGSYNTSTGVYSTSDTTYSIKAPVEFVISTEDDGRERREAKRSGEDVWKEPEQPPNKKVENNDFAQGEGSCQPSVSSSADDNMEGPQSAQAEVQHCN